MDMVLLMSLVLIGLCLLGFLGLAIDRYHQKRAHR